MVFCNLKEKSLIVLENNSHNPYFSRWFSAITMILSLLHTAESHNPYFSRWFSAIISHEDFVNGKIGHNPYFSRWFSAINL